MFSADLSPAAPAFYLAADRPLALKLARCFGNMEGDPRRGRRKTAAEQANGL
jgi:hypothetical protein